MKVLFACGGTAGHINPALAVATELRRRVPDCEILFCRQPRWHGGDPGAAGGLSLCPLSLHGHPAPF